MRSPLPHGCKFFIWPKYRFEYLGRTVNLTKTEGNILCMLVSAPGRRFFSRDLGDSIYDHKERGGPYSFMTVIPTQIFNMVRKFREGGIDINLKGTGTNKGYVFGHVCLIDNWEPSAEDAITHVRKRSPSESMMRQKAQGYEMFQRNVSGWTLPERMEDQMRRIR